MDDKYIDQHIAIVYSPEDDPPYYLERREPGNWGYSKKSFKTATKAAKAYKRGEVEWVK